MNEAGEADARRQRARTTFDRALSLLVEHDMQGFADLWAPEGTLDFPFASGDQPRHLDGREAVREYLRDYTDVVDVRDVHVRAVHATADPETLVAEWEAQGVVVATGKPYRMPYVAVVTVGEAGITGYRDYWDSALAARAAGRADTTGTAA